jgi:hypothetical protein
MAELQYPTTLVVKVEGGRLTPGTIERLEAFLVKHAGMTGEAVKLVVEDSGAGALRAKLNERDEQMDDDRLFRISWVDDGGHLRPDADEYVIAKSLAEALTWAAKRIAKSEFPESFKDATVTVTPLGLGPSRADGHKYVLVDDEPRGHP